MSWLRIDDAFSRHPKVLDLTEAQRWRWVALLCDCARNGGGKVRASMLREVRLPRGRLLELGLLDELENGELVIHDWEDYNAPGNTQAMRQRRYRMRQSGVSEDEVQRRAPEGERYVTRNVTGYVTTTSHTRAPASPETSKDGFAAKDDAKTSAHGELSDDAAGEDAWVAPAANVLPANLLTDDEVAQWLALEELGGLA